MTGIRWATLGLVLVTLVGVAGCAQSRGGADALPGPAVDEAELGSADGAGAAADGGTGSGGAPPPDGPGQKPAGPWPVGISSGQVMQGTPGKYCGGPNATMVGKATVSVAHGPVSVKVAWRPANGGATYGESMVQFSGTSAQSKTVTATWTRPWNSEQTVRVSFVDLVPAPGQQADQYIPPNPHDVAYAVPPCAKPDVDVKVVGVQVLPQKCSTGLAQVLAVAHVTIDSELSASTGPVSANFRWERADGFASSWVKLTFQPGGPKTLPMNTVWTLPAHGSFVAEAFVNIPVNGAPSHKYYADGFNFATYCIP
jgi:hypothetical protein